MGSRTPYRAHGGGMVLGNLAAYDSLISAYVAETGVPFLSVSYRLAPEVHGDVLAMDTFSALGWLASHAGDMDRVRLLNRASRDTLAAIDETGQESRPASRRPFRTRSLATSERIESLRVRADPPSG